MHLTPVSTPRSRESLASKGTIDDAPPKAIPHLRHPKYQWDAPELVIRTICINPTLPFASVDLFFPT
jgi:hypothetical protein